MTLPSEISRWEYLGNGSTTAFDYTSKILDQDDLKVYIVVDGVATLQTITTHYTVSNVGEAGGGKVTMVTAPAAGETLLIVREPAFTQNTSIRNQGSFAPALHEDAFDNQVAQSQSLRDAVRRSIKAPIQEDPADIDMDLPVAADRAGNILSFDDDGNPVATVSSTLVENIDANVAATAASAAAALVSENNAAASETAAASSETNAASSESFAEEWASNPEDAPITGDLGFSAKHYAAKAQASAGAATLPHEDVLVYIHPQTLVSDMTIPDGYNGWVGEPWTVDSGATVTLEGTANLYVFPDPATLATTTDVAAVEADYAAGADVDYLTPSTAASTYQTQADAATAHTFHGALVRRQAFSPQNFTASVFSAATWQEEEYDTDDFHSTSANTSRLTIPASLNGAKVVLSCCMNGDSTGSSFIGIDIEIRKGGSADYRGVGRSASAGLADGTTVSFQVFTAPVVVATGDYFEVYVKPINDTFSTDGINSWFSIRVVDLP